MVSTRSKRKQANEDFINLPYTSTSKKGKKKRKPKKSAKEKDVSLEIIDSILDENENLDSVDINEVAKNYKISNKPMKHKKKDKAKGRKDHKKFYDLHFFEVLRKQTERRWQKGFRIRYSTLARYKLVDEYRAWKEAQIAQGYTEFQEHLDMLNNEIIYQERFDQNIAEYVNPTAKYVSRVLAAQNIGSGITPDSIRIEINRENTPEVENEQITFNENYAQQSNQVIINEPQQESIQFTEEDLIPQSNNDRLDAFYAKNPKTTYTFGDAEKGVVSNCLLPLPGKVKVTVDNGSLLVDTIAPRTLVVYSEYL